MTRSERAKIAIDIGHQNAFDLNIVQTLSWIIRSRMESSAIVDVLIPAPHATTINLPIFTPTSFRFTR
ncbi:MAG: hypothetical protein M0C28_43935 [Candidatus Moduliflexus flocculans]|nr:hypothetical protein [Candidatus Moduliflexus flocculans]